MEKTENNSPSTNGANGRSPNGQFTKGNDYGKGNPHAAAVGAWRNALAETITPEHIKGAIAVLLNAALRDKERWAVIELLDRCLGKPQQSLAVDANIEQGVNLPDNYLQFLDWLSNQEGDKK